MNFDYEIAERSSGLKASAVFFKRDKFNCIKKGVMDLDEQAKANPMVYCLLEEKNSTLKFVTASVHLKGLYGAVDKDKRFKQTVKVTEFFKTQYADVPVVLCGDLNDVPGSLPLKTLESSFVDFY